MSYNEGSDCSALLVSWAAMKIVIGSLGNRLMIVLNKNVSMQGLSCVLELGGQVKFVLKHRMLS